MEAKHITLSDHITTRDYLTNGRGYIGKDGKVHRGSRTSITAVDSLGQILFEKEENTQVLGGAIHTLEELFKVKSELQIDTLNDILNIANDGPELTPEQLAMTSICLFGVGTSGAGDVIGSVKDVDYRERELGEMIPMRVTDQPLPSNEADRYGFRKLQDNGKTASYLKTFDTEPIIKVLWADGEGGEDGTKVEDNPHESPRTTPIDTFIEMQLTITTKDLREYFTDRGNIEAARFNTIGLFTGVLGEVGDGTQDYRNVKLYSKFNFNNESLDLPKNITFYYRIFMS